MQNFRDRISVQKCAQNAGSNIFNVTHNCLCMLGKNLGPDFGFGFEIAELSDLPYYRYLETLKLKIPHKCFFFLSL